MKFNKTVRPRGHSSTLTLLVCTREEKEVVGYFPARVEVWLPPPFFFSPAAACQASKFGPGVEMEGDSGGGGKESGKPKRPFSSVPSR